MHVYLNILRFSLNYLAGLIVANPSPNWVRWAIVKLRHLIFVRVRTSFAQTTMKHILCFLITLLVAASASVDVAVEASEDVALPQNEQVSRVWLSGDLPISVGIGQQSCFLTCAPVLPTLSVLVLL